MGAEWAVLMLSAGDIATKIGDNNRLLGQLVQAIVDRTSTWQLANPLPILQGGTGATDAATARANFGLEIGVDVQAYSANNTVREICWMIDGGGEAITTGLKWGLPIPFGCAINSVTLGADQTGSVVVDIWKDGQANFPPTVADSITASAKPTLSSASTSVDTTLTGWTTSISAGDWLYFNVDSVSTITFLTVALKVTTT